MQEEAPEPPAQLAACPHTRWHPHLHTEHSKPPNASDAGLSLIATICKDLCRRPFLTTCISYETDLELHLIW